MNSPIVTLYNESDHLGIILIRDEYQKVIKRKEQEPFASILWLLMLPMRLDAANLSVHPHVDTQ